MTASDAPASRFAPSTPLPTGSAGFSPPEKVDVPAVGARFVTALEAAFAVNSAAGKAPDVSRFAELFAPAAFWRDHLAFSRGYRTFQDETISLAAQDLLGPACVRSVRLTEPPPALEQPYPDLAWVRVHAEFSTALGKGTAVARLVYVEAQAEWKVWTLFTTLESLHDRPRRDGVNRPFGRHNDPEPYDVRRKREMEFEDGDPDVLVIGAGHNGLATAAMLRAFGLNPLVVDRAERIGDSWRKRYASLALQDPVWSNHLPMMPFPSNWPVFMPAGKLANWLEAYAEAMELNVWLRSTVDPAQTRWDADHQRWELRVLRSVNGEVRARDIAVSHVVLATGLVGPPRLPPPFPGQEAFGGTIVHSSEHPGGGAWKGKRALVVGACTSALDIAADLVHHGAETTLLQRSPTYVMSLRHGLPVLTAGVWTEEGNRMYTIEQADRIAESLPPHVWREFQKRTTAQLAEADKDMLAGLERAGFRTWLGIDGTGFATPVAQERAGGTYFASPGGGADLIIKGRISVQSGEIARFSRTGVEFTSGAAASFDLIIFATGFENCAAAKEATLGAEARRLGRVWGLDGEGEVRGVGGPAGPNVFVAATHLLFARSLSRNIALQIAAERDGIWAPAYEKHRVELNP